MRHSYPPSPCRFISCMEESISKEFHDEFKDLVFELPKKQYCAMIDAVGDMYLLGLGKEMMCTPRSTFSEVAWWQGGALIPEKMLYAEMRQ